MCVYVAQASSVDPDAEVTSVAWRRRCAAAGITQLV